MVKNKRAARRRRRGKKEAVFIMRDPRIDKLADVLVNYSVHCQKGEKVLIEARGIDAELVTACVEKVFAAGGYPFADIIDLSVERALLTGTGEEHCKLRAKYAKYRMEDMDCYIGIRGGSNTFELSDVPAENMQVYDRLYSFPVHHETRVKKTKWVVLRYPNPSMAQNAGVSTEKFEDFYFDVCTLDYSKMDRAMDALQALMEKTDKVRLVAKDTDLTFSIKGIPAIKCAGHMNIPDGEVYTAPVKDSVNGVITYNAPTLENGIKHENVRLVFKNGKSSRRPPRTPRRSTPCWIPTRARGMWGNSPSASTRMLPRPCSIFCSTKRSPAPSILRPGVRMTTHSTETSRACIGIWFSS